MSDNSYIHEEIKRADQIWGMLAVESPDGDTMLFHETCIF
jgi:hypothetical protein